MASSPLPSPSHSPGGPVHPVPLLSPSHSPGGPVHPVPLHCHFTVLQVRTHSLQQSRALLGITAPPVTASEKQLKHVWIKGDVVVTSNHNLQTDRVDIGDKASERRAIQHRRSQSLAFSLTRHIG